MGRLPSDRVLFTGSSTATEKSYEYPAWGMSVWTGLLFDLGTAPGRRPTPTRTAGSTMGEALRYAPYYAQAITLEPAPARPADARSSPATRSAAGPWPTRPPDRRPA